MTSGLVWEDEKNPCSGHAEALSKEMIDQEIVEGCEMILNFRNWDV
jgi:hypothetical protein